MSPRIVAVTLLAALVACVVSATSKADLESTAERSRALAMGKLSRGIDSHAQRMKLYRDLAAAFKKHFNGVSLDKNFQSRAMKQQQSSSGSATCDQVAFQTQLLGLVAQCPAITQADSAFSGNGTTAEFDALCGNDCPSKFETFVGANVNCFSGGLPEGRWRYAQTKSLVVACRKDNGVYCGQTLGLLYTALACSKLTAYGKATCTALPMCDWVNDECAVRSDTTTIGGLCTKCLRDMVASLVAVDPSFTSRLMQMVYNEVVCKKVDGKYCLPIMSAFSTKYDSVINAKTSIPTRSQYQDMLTEACTSGTTLGCFRALSSFDELLKLETAKAVYSTCIQYYRSSLSSRQYYCFPAMDKAIRSYISSTNGDAEICARTSTNEYCVSFLSEFASATRSCGLYAANLGTAASCCTASSFLSNRSCCLHTLVTFLSGGDDSYPADQFPATRYIYPPPPGDTSLPMSSVIPNDGVATGTTIPSSGYTTMVATLNAIFTSAQCSDLSAATVASGIANMCAEPRSVADPKGTLKLKIKFQALQNDANFRARVKASLRQDVAAVSAVSASQIVNDTLSSDSSTTVNVAHQFHGLQASSSTTPGTRYDFAIAAGSDTEAAAASSTLNAAISSGNVDVPTTLAVVSNDCGTSCTDGSGSLVAGGGTSGGSSSAVTFSALLATILCVLVTVF